MSVIDVKIGNTRYQIDCADGEEEKIERLAAKLNQRFEDLSKNIPGVDERTKLMFCSLMIEEELESVKTHSLNEHQVEKAKLNREEIHSKLADNMKNVAVIIESITRKIRSC